MHLKLNFSEFRMTVEMAKEIDGHIAQVLFKIQYSINLFNSFSNGKNNDPHFSVPFSPYDNILLAIEGIDQLKWVYFILI